jgi:hypothetical protein
MGRNQLDAAGEKLRDLPIVGDLAKGFGVESAEERKTREAFDEMQKALQEYRRPSQEARMQGLSQQLGLFDQTMNPVLAKMYGPAATMDLSGLMNNPAAGLLGPPVTPERQRANQQADDLFKRNPEIVSREMAADEYEKANAFNSDPVTDRPLTRREQWYTQQRPGRRTTQFRF